MSWRGVVLGACMAVAFPITSWAQGTEISVGASGLLSVQPIDDAYVGDPYLSNGIGGLGPGMSAAFTIVTERGLIVAGEFSTAWFETEQSGRLVPAPCPPNTPSNECPFVGGISTTQLNDSLLGALVGYSAQRGVTQVQVLGGAYFPLDRPTVNGQPLPESTASDTQPDLPVALGGGLDVVQGVATRAALVIGARYIYVPRDEPSQFLGIGPHLIRAGVGVRIRLN
jgi:hypothetical protein